MLYFFNKILLINTILYKICFLNLKIESLTFSILMLSVYLYLLLKKKSYAESKFLRAIKIYNRLIKFFWFFLV